MTNIYIYANNCPEFYKTIESLRRKVRWYYELGHRVEPILLAESSMMKKLVYAVCKYAAKFNKHYSAKEKSKARLQIARMIVDEVEEEL